MIKIRLKRTGKKKQPSYQIIAIDSRKKRDASYLEKLGHYFPLHKKHDLNEAKTLKWLSVGAKPTETVKKILIKEQVLVKFNKSKISSGVKNKMTPVTSNLRSKPTKK